MRTELETLRQQLSDMTQDRDNKFVLIQKFNDEFSDQIKREVMLRDALNDLASCMQGVIEGDYTPDSFTLQPANTALAATVDLKDVRLCHAEPVGMMHESGNAIYAGCDCNIDGYTVQVFRAWKPRP